MLDKKIFFFKQTSFPNVIKWSSFVEYKFIGNQCRIKIFSIFKGSWNILPYRENCYFSFDKYL